MDRRVHEDQVRPGALKAVDRALAAVRGAVVDDDEHALRRGVGLDVHELLDQRVERLDPVLGRAAVEDLRATDVPRGQVAERALPLVLVLDELPVAAGCGRRAGVLASRSPGSTVSRPRRRRSRLARAAGPPSGPRRDRARARPSRGSPGRAGRSRSGSSRGGSRPLTASARPSTAEICATIPRVTASRASSALDQRESGTPSSAGSSHANAFTSATCAGGKRSRTARPRSLLEPRKSLVEEALAPLRHRLARDIQPLGDLRVRQTLAGQQDRLRPHDIPPRPRVSRRPATQLALLLDRQLDPVRTRPRHQPRLPRPTANSSHANAG